MPPRQPAREGLASRAALRAYGLAAWLAQPLLRRKLRRRAQAEAGYAEAVPERFGRYTTPAQTQAELLWIHAVSLGETRTAGLLIAALRERIPDVRILLTHGTATGRAEGRQLLQGGDLQCWLPWDTPGAVRRFFAHFRPAMGLLIETEVWPNLIDQAAHAGVPLWLVNARLNAKSLAGAQRLPALMRPAYAGLAAVYAQTEQDAGRLRAAGASVTAVTGNLKFDARPDARLLAQGRDWRTRFRQRTGRPIVMLASSRAGEEAQWLNAIRTTAGAQDLQWLVVPRHPQRFDEVAALARERGLVVSRRSQWPADGEAPPAADLWLGDSMGEMALYYGLADLALLGASFEPLGGQNLIEACACGCPVVMGPHTFNFAQSAEDALAQGVAWRAGDMTQAVALALQQVRDPAQLRLCSTRAEAFAQHHRGALARLADAVALALHRHALPAR
ncbi:3-deoxy-D-manno-octulosonic acid transferase [Corticibacter populi]|uniref:3-deoxy-D-manno-octulosonic acid transferase n=1 Tax=Corticibacter populi TaxID=1550736 RepID=A0A3M6QKQ4_9BURK|nr:3-deoxy-D-manno-octulosonic acid transferase [Corticibacter populi]RMX03515.1 3-deoxy-D-manno-octulosonic acid transferase [Corticibacter populi]RZS29960.1 3-deoxy-D-manno-octulosonic-acid transferase [Corticibacter populi]